MESGEIRYSKTGISKLLGYAAKWINGLRSDSPNVFNALLSKGYTDYALRVSVKREGKQAPLKLKYDDKLVEKQ